MSAAQVTEAHKQLAYAILFASEDGHAGPNEATQLIADSEAAAKQSLLAAYDAVVVQRNRVTTERDQLRAECNNLLADLDEIKAIRDEETARAERAEALHLDAIDEAGAQAKVMNEYRLRAERAEAELAAERARLDWLQAHALAQHSENISISKLGKRYNGFPGSLRAAIDAAMKEDAK